MKGSSLAKRSGEGAKLLYFPDGAYLEGEVNTMGKFGFSWSWKRAIGLSGAKAGLSSSLGQSTLTIPRVLVALATMIAAGCRAENEENTASEEALKVFDTIGKELETLQACATDPVTGQDLSSFAGFPLPPKDLQAGVDLPTKVDGKRGSCAVDVDGDGIKEEVESWPRASTQARGRST